MDAFILNENGNDAARSGLLRLHDTVGHREAGRPEAALSPDELLSRFRAADPTRNAAYLPWLLRTYAVGGYRLEDLSKAHDTLAAFARLRGQLPNMSTIDGEVRNPRKLGSHMTLASLWKAVAPLIEAERLAEENKTGEDVDTARERALSQSRVIHRSNRVVMAVPMTEEASCWWGRGTQWCTAARNGNAFEQYHSKAPLIVVCLRKSGDLPARKLQLYVHADDMQFMDENDAEVSPELIFERWQDLEMLLHWAVSRSGMALYCVPEPLRTEAVCLAAVSRDGQALRFVPEPLCTEAMCTVAVGGNGLALRFVPEPLRTEVMCLTAVGRSGMALKYVPEPLCTEAVCLVAVNQDGYALAYVPEPLRTEAICTTAVGGNGLALHYVPEPLCTEAIYLAALGRDGMALRYIPKPLRTEAICITAVSRDGLALQFIPEPLRTEVICLTAVGNNGIALLYVPKPLRTEAICTVAVGRNGEALYYVPEPLRTEAICTIAVVRDKQKSVSTTSETNEWESHDLVLAGLEDCLKNLQSGHQKTIFPTKLGMV